MVQAPAQADLDTLAVPVRVLGVSPTLNAAEGAPRSLLDILGGLAGRGVVAPSVWSPLGGSGVPAARAEGLAVAVDPGPAPRRFIDGLWTPREYRRFQSFARAYLRRARPEVVLANTLLAFPMVEAAAAAGIPAVWVLLESYSEAQLRQLFPEYACRRIEAALAMAARVVPVSHATAERYARFNTRRNVRVIHNGLDPAPFDAYLRRTSRADAARLIQAPPGKRVVLAVGTVCERKGQHTLVEATARLARVARRLRLSTSSACATACRTPNTSAQLVARHGLEGVVRLVPETGDVRPYYRAADVFVNTSHLEAYCLSVLEAEAFGLPVVSTPCPGVDEQVAWGANALRFPASDAAALADALAALLDSPAKREDMGRESRAAFDAHLSDREMLDRYAGVILSVRSDAVRIEEPHPPAPSPKRRGGARQKTRCPRTSTPLPVSGRGRGWGSGAACNRPPHRGRTRRPHATRYDPPPAPAALRGAEAPPRAARHVR